MRGRLKCDRWRTAALALSCLALTAISQASADTASPVRGVVKTVHQAEITSEVDSAISRLTRREGERFAKGDVLVEFDCRRQQAQLDAAKAGLREAQLSVDSNAKLLKRGAIARLDVEIAQVRADKVAAEARVLEARVSSCVILAPFDGRVADLGVHQFEIPGQGKPFIRLIDDRNLEIEMIVPSTWLNWLAAGRDFQFRVDETGNSYGARVARIGASVDPVSQTVRIVATFDSAPVDILPGMSGTALIAATEG